MASTSPHIVVGTDGSATAAAAVRRAAELASAQHATLHLVTAYDPTLTRAQRDEIEAMPSEIRWKASPGETAERLLASAADAVARDLGPARRRVTVERHARPGEPTDVLVHLAEELGADLLVVGNKGLQGLLGWVVPSVPSRISHRAPCDVLIVDTVRRAA